MDYFEKDEIILKQRVFLTTSIIIETNFSDTCRIDLSTTVAEGKREFSGRHNIGTELTWLRVPRRVLIHLDFMTEIIVMRRGTHQHWPQEQRLWFQHPPLPTPDFH